MVAVRFSVVISGFNLRFQPWHAQFHIKKSKRLCRRVGFHCSQRKLHSLPLPFLLSNFFYHLSQTFYPVSRGALQIVVLALVLAQARPQARQLAQNHWQFEDCWQESQSALVVSATAQGL